MKIRDKKKEKKKRKEWEVNWNPIKRSFPIQSFASFCSKNETVNNKKFGAQYTETVERLSYMAHDNDHSWHPFQSYPHFLFLIH